MITKVLHYDGTVIHDCKALGCDVSWSGHNLETGELVEGATDQIPDGYIDKGNGVAQLQKAS